MRLLEQEEPMSLSQTQIIRSLGEALQWFEKELAWGAQIAELRHLTGRIGELYTAMITRGQMAKAVNQVGYDVVSAEGEKISVKTITSSTHVSFNASTLQHATRVMILQIEVEENEPSIRELFNCTIEELRPLLRESNGSLRLLMNHRSGALARTSSYPIEDLKEVAASTWKHLRVVQLENGTILVKEGEQTLPQALPVLREIARDIGVDVLNAMSNPKNTRTLGSDIIKALG
ncbi:hypothetical protein [Paracoccus sp. SSK6]|uniref:DUF6998 domain-containing protein n=1 Tax=Paracoccus sp. SSK6 TaxID=3143131 RepID=UPI003218EC4C